ncbi:MAG: HAMP domain-containing histidine kinase [Epsilonproteobacteria bacterium]|nr:HAMP domain-containing histidine kinase [Campylobacterota bacterium]
MATLVLITSFSLYIYIKVKSNLEIKESLEQQAKYLLKDFYNLPNILNTQKDILKNSLNIEAKLQNAPYLNFKPKYFRIIKDKNKYYMQGFFAYNFRSQTYLVLTKDITKKINLQNVVYKAVILVNIASLVIIIIYAFFLSKMLIRPINIVSKNIAKMNETKLNKINIKNLPQEFEPLGIAINSLINKVDNFIKYKKELFIGAAHELKTPLAVMKTKAQVSLLKKDKSIESLTKALEQNIKSIDTLNNTIESILAFGRAEGAQFEEKKEIDIIKFIEDLIEEFEIVAIREEKFIIKKLRPLSLKTKIQPSLLRQILQNLIQNAIRFTPKKSSIKISSFLCKNYLVVRIKDNGPGVPEHFDIFAPFKRAKNSPGTGLGLFLAKNAANSIEAKLSLKNRAHKKGAVATIMLPIH